MAEKITDIASLKLDYSAIANPPTPISVVENGALTIDDNNVMGVSVDNSTVKVISGKLTAIGGGSGTSLVKIYDNDDDAYQGKLWLEPNGEIIIDDEGYSVIEVYYSQKDTSDVQFFKLEMELVRDPKTNKGMFYVLDTGSAALFSIEQVKCTVVTVDETSKIKLATMLSNTSNSIVKIERVYGGI